MPGCLTTGVITVKYLLMIYANQDTFAGFAPEEIQRLIADTEAQQAALKESGEWLAAYGVADQVNCKTVTTRSGEALVTDGPYIETKEYLGSFDIIDSTATNGPSRSRGRAVRRVSARSRSGR